MNLSKEFVKECKSRSEGTILEFGTATGDSAVFLSENCKKNDRIITIDGFEGLPSSEKDIPDNWVVGAFKGDGGHKAKKRLAKYENISVIHSWINELKSPIAYNVGTVIAANIDVDIYESTVDSLSWLDRCDWLNDEVIIRFDDWDSPVGGRVTEDVKRRIELHNKLAYSEFLDRTGYISETIAEDEYCAVFKVKRK